MVVIWGTCGSSKSALETVSHQTCMVVRSAHISVHVIVFPTLKGCSRVVSMSAVNFYELVKQAASKIEVLIPKMLAQDQEDLLS